MLGPGQDTAQHWGCPGNWTLLTAQEWLQNFSGLPPTGASVISCVSSFRGLVSNRQVGHCTGGTCVALAGSGSVCSAAPGRGARWWAQHHSGKRQLSQDTKLWATLKPLKRLAGFLEQSCMLALPPFSL